MKVTTLHLWLDGCPADTLSAARLEDLLTGAIEAAGQTSTYYHTSEDEGRTVALAVVGKAHVVLHGDPQSGSLAAEILSAQSQAMAEAIQDYLKAKVPHQKVHARSLSYILGDTAPSGEKVDVGLKPLASQSAEDVEAKGLGPGMGDDFDADW